MQSETPAGVTLFEDEELLHDIQPSWLAYWPSITIYTLFGLVTFGLGLPLLYLPYAKRKNTRYVITSERVIIKSGGVLSSETTEYSLENVNKVESSQDFAERARNKGTVSFTLRERGFEDETVELSGISEFNGVRESIRRAQVNSE